MYTVIEEKSDLQWVVFLLARCMALSTAVFVGESAKWLPELVERSQKLKVNAGHEAGADLGPVISPAAKERICSLVQSGIDEGAKCLLDGRNIMVPGYENGNFVGPTILADVKVRCPFILITFSQGSLTVLISL